MTIFTLTVTFSQAARADIRSKNEDPNYVRVTRVQDNTIRFELCERTAVGDACEQIGARTYSEAELGRLRNTYYVKAAGLATAELAAAGAAAFAGSFVGFWGAGIAAEVILGTSAPATMGAALWGAMGGVVAGAWTGIKVTAKYLSPFSRIKKGRSIRKVIVSDQEVFVKGTIKDFAATLSETLATLN